VTPYSDVSYWLESSGDLAPRPSLDGPAKADVAILGAGFTGLWTAYELLRRDPSMRVVVLERDIAGFGASGRNGGWCSSELNAGISLLSERFGGDGARRVQQAMYDTVDEVGRVTAAEGIDAAYHKGGMLMVARGASSRQCTTPSTRSAGSPPPRASTPRTTRGEC